MFSQRVLGTGTIAVGNRCMSIFVHACCFDRKSHFCLIIPTGAFLHNLQFLNELCKGKTPRTFFSPTHFYHIIPVKCLIGKQSRLKGQCHEMFHLYLRDSNRSGQIFHMLRYFRVQFRICGDICMCKNFTVFGTQRTKQFCNLSKEFFFFYMRQFCS